MNEFKEKLDMILEQLKIEANQLPRDKYDFKQMGKMEAYSHCYIELLNLKNLIPNE